MKSKKNKDDKEPKTEETDTLSPEEEIQKLKEEVDDYNEKFLRVVADFDNFRKRIDRDRDQQALRLKGEVVSNFLDIIDTVEKAVQVDYPDLTSSKNGILGIHKLLSAFMDSFEIKRFDPEGEQFDFRQHEALTTVEKEGVEPNTIVEVIQSGYTLEGEILRPAKVVVSKNLEEKSEKVEVEGE
tara:strand:+ start:5853 stop:6404 length:552 start_codon:yes stop_codon:yes gene_type:complete